MIRLGILGGGQLGMMLLQAKRPADIFIKVLDPNPEASCNTLADEFVVGSFADYDTVYHFGKTVDVLTIEIEHVNLEALKQLQIEGVKVYPQPEVLEVIQDKGRQKLFYQNHNLPTAPFQLIKDVDEVKTYTGSFPVIQKLRRLGYDGKGVKKINNSDELNAGFTEPSVLEQHVLFVKELAVIVARNPRGEVVTYPTVEMEFHPTANLVEFLASPARIPITVEQHAQQLARQVAEAFGVVGVLAVEMFLCADNTILINEVAPRPHNSGHHTIEGSRTSQFEQHLRALVDLPLGDTNTINPAVMINVLGAEGYTGPAKYIGLDEVQQQPGVYVHLYNKTITKPFRKMGHVTVLNQSLDEAIRVARWVQKTLRVQT